MERTISLAGAFREFTIRGVALLARGTAGDPVDLVARFEPKRTMN